MYWQLTTALEVCTEPGEVVGRFSRFQTFSKTPPLSTEPLEVGVTALGGQGLLKQKKIAVGRDGSNLFFLDTLLCHCVPWAIGKKWYLGGKA